jgi:hypothetical protein
MGVYAHVKNPGVHAGVTHHGRYILSFVFVGHFFRVFMGIIRCDIFSIFRRQRQFAMLYS